MNLPSWVNRLIPKHIQEELEGRAARMGTARRSFRFGPIDIDIQTTDEGYPVSSHKCGEE